MPPVASDIEPDLPIARQLSEADDGETVDMHPGERLQVVLPGQPTAGYQWELAPVKGKALASLGPPAYRASSKATGSGGVFAFGFAAVAAGKATIRLTYRRPFEKDKAPLKSFRVTVMVE